MLEVMQMTNNEFAKRYADYIRSQVVGGKKVTNPMKENLFLIEGDNVVDMNHNVIGTYVRNKS